MPENRENRDIEAGPVVVTVNVPYSSTWMVNSDGYATDLNDERNWVDGQDFLEELQSESVEEKA